MSSSVFGGRFRCVFGGFTCAARTLRASTSIPRVTRRAWLIEGFYFLEDVREHSAKVMDQNYLDFLVGFLDTSRVTPIRFG